MNSSKLLSIVLCALGVLILVLAIAFTLSSSNLDPGGRVLGIGLGALIALPLIGLAAVLFNRGRGEAVEDVIIGRQRKLYNMVQAQGQVDLRQVALELNVTRDDVREMVRDLIGKQLFSGYVDWDGGVLYSSDAAKLKDGTCPKCGGKLELAGKGLVKCQYCGSEVFLT